MGKGNELNTQLQHLLVSAVNAVLKIQNFCQKKPYSAIRVSNLSTEVKRQKWKLWYMILNWVKILVLSYFFKNDGKHFNVELYQSYFTLFIEKNLRFLIVVINLILLRLINLNITQEQFCIIWRFLHSIPPPQFGHLTPFHY